MSKPIAIGLSLILALAAPSGRAAAAPPSEVRIGMVETMFHGVPPAFIGAMSKQFGSVVKKYSGMTGQVEMSPTAAALSEQLDKGEVDVAVFHGLDFARAKAEHPEFKALMVAVPTCDHYFASLVVRADADTADFADLDGKTIAIAKRNRDHCRVYFARERQRVGGLGNATITEPTNPADALDDVASGKADAAIIDPAALTDSYAKLKPGQARALKILKTSEEFPLSVVVYREGNVDMGMVARFREGLNRVHTSREGKFMLRLWKLSKFADLPADYDAKLSAITKAFPAE